MKMKLFCSKMLNTVHGKFVYLTQNDTYLSVCEEEDGVGVLHSCNVVQRLEILVEG